MRQSRTSWIIALFIVGAVAEPAMAASTTPGDWSDENGSATATRLIAECVASKPYTRGRDGSVECAAVPFDVCTHENGGNDSQTDINICMGFSRRAWGERYDALLARFDPAFARWDGRPWISETKRRFHSQEQAWQRWMSADCEMMELGSVGGSIHNANVSGCEVEHIASRARELAPFLHWLENR